MKRTIGVGVALVALTVQAEVRVTADRADARYRCGETANFVIDYTPGEKAPAGKLDAVIYVSSYGRSLAKTNVVVTGKEPVRFTFGATMAEPGFAICRVQEPGAKDFVRWGVAFSPEKIRVATPRPADFDAYWDGEVARLKREVPLDPKVVRRTEGPEAVTRRTFNVSFATFNGKRVYGTLSLPKKKTAKPLPVRVHVPGAGSPTAWVGPGDWSVCRDDEIYLVMNVHPFDYPMDEKKRVEEHEARQKKYLKTTGVRSYCQQGAWISREAYYFHDTILGVNRAIDWVAAHPEVDSSDITYLGASQGGGWGYYLLGLNKHFRRGAMMVAAFCDHGGELAHRNAGYSGILNAMPTKEMKAKAAEITPYFDAAHFAPRIQVPVLATIGFLDTTCAPSSSYAAYNALGTKRKGMMDALGLGHGTHQRFYKASMEWTRAKDDAFPPPDPDAVLPND